MNSAAIDIKTMLEAESGLGLVFGTDLFVSYEPASPDNCVTIYDTGGGMPDITLQNGQYNRDDIQIRVRNNNYADAMNVIYSLVGILQGKTYIVNNIFYALIRETIAPYHIGYDDNNRAIIVVNFQTQRRNV